MSVSAWNVGRRDVAQTPRQISSFLPAAQWDEALLSARAKQAPILVYVGMTGPLFASLHRELEGDPVLKKALQRFVPVAAFLDGPEEDRALATLLGAVAAPDFLIVAPEPGGPEVIAHLDTVTGSAFERFGLTAELWCIAEGETPVARLGAAELASEAESGINGLRERYLRLQAAVEAFDVPTPADVETPLGVHLATESNGVLRYYGWSLLASWLERGARAAAASGGQHLGVPSARWETRLRETTRRAWISCPDDRLAPFGGLLIQRYARAPKDLDSLDRAFMGAVVRTLSKAPGADEFPGQDWLVEARAALPPPPPRRK